MNRTFKKFTIQTGGTPQPVVGTWFTAAAVPNGPDFQGEQLATATVADSSMFQQGDYCLAIAVNLTNPEVGRIQKVINGTTVLIRGLTKSRAGGVFGTGDFLQLWLPVNRGYIQATPGNAGLLFVGTQGIVKATFANVIATLLNLAAGIQPVEYADSRYYTADPLNTADLWIDGTTGDGYLPSFGVA